MEEVPPVKTPTTEAQASVYLVVALTKALQAAPSEQVATYSMALAWIETARGQSIVMNNPGNLMAGADWNGDFWRPPWYGNDPKYAKLHALMLEGKAPSAFRAYEKAQDGWDAFAREIVRRKPLLSAMAADDALAVVRALRSTKYSQDYSDGTAPSFASLAAEFRSRNLFGGLPKQFEVVAPQPQPFEVSPGQPMPTPTPVPYPVPEVKTARSGGAGILLALLAAAGVGAVFYFGSKRG